MSRAGVWARYRGHRGPDRGRGPRHLGVARRVATRRIFRFPTTMQVTPWSERVKGPAGLMLDSVFEWTGKTEGQHTLALTVAEPLLPANKAEDYREFVNRARNLNGISFVVPFKGDKMAAAQKSAGWITWTVWILIVGGLAMARTLGG